MFEGCRVAVVVPAYQEAELIERTLETIPAIVDHVIVVDDGSTDETSLRAERARDPRVEVLRHSDNRGVGAAIATGYRAAFRRHRADVAVVMAGDGQMDPNDLRALLEPVARGRCDYSKGERMSHPARPECMPITRQVGNVVLSQLTEWSLGVRVRDSQCGYTALSRRAAEHIDWDRLWTTYGYPNDLLARILAAGLTVEEVPVRPVYGFERSKLRLHHGILVVPYVIVRAGLRRWRSEERPERVSVPLS